ncbi:DUF2460 domain-containing protein [Pseudomonas multiresinivorans]|uniref:DUF2460 domain-containing protein n=1 Tax=Pseudomonas multiresinivorans TaxID=95301 RepID=A0A7Z3BKH0_9PSED|nr:DUF2460 domain-containing protein [Pseudomonas multiresinivorans]QJP08411.1 hypothetical protein G4G71_11195 [Pseudomonas multiresinivorans]
MGEFLEERLAENIDYGSGFGSSYAVDTVQTAGGNEYRSLKHPFIKASMTIEFERQTNFIISEILDLNNRAGGTFRGFRAMHPADYSTKNYREPPTAFDQPMVLVNPTVPGVYQLMRWYGDSSDASCIRRRIRKPVAGTVKVGVHGAAFPTAQWSVDNTTGIVTMAGNKNGTITNITKGSTTTITVANSMAVGESVLIANVVGMTQINGMRAPITAASGTSVTVAINSTGFSDYVSGGALNTAPQTGESVTAGSEFDIPMRFSADLSSRFSNWDTIDAGSIDLLEILNP